MEILGSSQLMAAGGGARACQTSSISLNRLLSMLRFAFLLALTPSFASMAASNAAGLDRGNFDPEMSACKDFYVFANGTWLKNNPVPPAFSSWGTFNELEQRNMDRLRAIAEAAALAKASPGSPEQQVGAFFQSAMDQTAIDKAAIKPLDSVLDRIASIENREDLARVIRASHVEATPVLFGFNIRQDLTNPESVTVYFGQGGLGLPNRDFYLRDDAESKKQLEAYREHIKAMLVLAGAKSRPAARDAKAIVAMEKRFAAVHLPREEMRNPANSYKLLSLPDADKVAPAFSWSQLLSDLGASGVAKVSLPHPKFFAEMQRSLKSEPLSTWRAYLRWHALRAASPFLSQPFEQENFRFYRQQLAGQKQQRPRAERVIEQMNLMLGEPLGQLFVAKHFPPEAKARMMRLIANLRTALKARLEQLPWMGEETRKQALEKWASFTPKIGYPEKWVDFSSVPVQADDYFGNVRRLAKFNLDFDLAKLGKPIDRSEWGMPPQQVNAYYNPLWNEVVFPAGILQPPFFDMAADDALNYGAIGSVIGHELMHGFDDSGSRFDAKGALRMWWSEGDRKEFESRANKLVEQASEFRAIGDLRLNGRVSLGENIADLGGLKIAHAALQSAMQELPSEPIDGFTSEQRFFLGWAQVWRRNWTDQALKLQINTGPHAPGKFRVNGPLANLEEFAKAFSCQEGDPMVRPEATRVSIW
jgi:putative endopeptidase